MTRLRSRAQTARAAKLRPQEAADPPLLARMTRPGVAPQREVRLVRLQAAALLRPEAALREAEPQEAALQEAALQEAEAATDGEVSRTRQ